jgi:AcrR family transcriptional regulator
MNSSENFRKRGRPREFCEREVLVRALDLFWTKGYDGASLDELTQTMGISRPSLYAAFGSKGGLFREALDLYERENLSYIAHAIEKPTAREVTEFLLHGAIEAACAHGRPRGCVGVISSVACSLEAEPIRNEAIKRGKLTRAALTKRFERASIEGDLPARFNPQGLTGVVAALLQGIAVQAAQGATRHDLQLLMEASLHLWSDAFTKPVKP